MPAKLLILGIDAASPTLLRRWANEGQLPAIRDLMARGVSGAVRGVKGFFIGSTWPSFYTGLSPAGHGFYRIEQRCNLSPIAEINSSWNQLARRMHGQISKRQQIHPANNAGNPAKDKRFERARVLRHSAWHVAERG